MGPLMACVAFILLLVAPERSAAAITQIIDSTGDGGGNVLITPGAIAADDSGNVYVAGEGSDNVFRITPGGAIEEIIDSTGDGGGNGLDKPSGIAIDSIGNAYVTGFNSHNVFKIAPGGGTITVIIDSGGNLFNPRGIDVDANDNVYVAGLGSDNAFQITPVGSIFEIIDSTGDGGGNLLDRPIDVAVGPNGNVFVIGSASDNVFEITPNGSISQIIDASGDGGVHLFEDPHAIAVDVDGFVFIQTDDGSVFRVAPSGDIAETFQTERGEAIAVDSSGNLYVVNGLDFGLANAFQITPFGDVTEIIDGSGDGAGNPFEIPGSAGGGVVADLDGNVFATGWSSANAFRIPVGLPVCNDGIDNDIDGLIDFPNDPGCEILASVSETSVCDDGVDNDLDGLTDFPDDPGCGTGAGAKEDPECADGIDNDSDGAIDFSQDKQCDSRSDDSESEFPIDWVGTLELEIGSLPSVMNTGTGVAYLSGSTTAASELRLAGGVGLLGTVFDVSPNFTIYRMQLSATLGSGTLLPVSGTGSFARGAVPLRGILRFCIFSQCDFGEQELSLDLTTASGANGVGIGSVPISGDVTYMYAGTRTARFSILGAPWTLGAATLSSRTPSGALVTVMKTGFIHDQASSSTLSAGATLQLIAPVQIASKGLVGNHDKIAMFATLTLQFVPEPSLLLAVAAGVVALTFLGRSKSSSGKPGRKPPP